METARRITAALGACLCIAGGAPASAQDMPGAVLELEFTPAPRAQIAVWLEHADGRFIRTLALTEAVAYRGIGNRPGASQMNSGYRWPYGRREGVLPIWATRRAAAAGAMPFKRVIFQDRTYEGLASRTTADHSIDDYFCLSFDRDTTSRDALDAVSCASVFTSDKGRFVTADDVSAGYSEPWEDPHSGVGSAQPLPLDSLYPPRMDVTRCTDASCYDHADVADYVTHVRAVMPEIDAVTVATLPGFVAQSLLFSVPPEWPRGSYKLWIEINVEGDYNATYDDSSYPTPTTPATQWDSWAMDYGYAYRGQPSLAYVLPFELDAQGEATYATAQPSGRASWDTWTSGYGALESMSGMTDDPGAAPGSGADRLVLNDDGQRVTLAISTLTDLAEPDPDNEELPDLTGPGSSMPDEPEGGAGAGGEPDPDMPDEGDSDGPSTSPGGGPRTPPDRGVVIIATPDAELDGPVGTIRGLRLGAHGNKLHAHEWITLGFEAAESEQPLHRYEVRVSTEPIEDEDSFIREGRPAKTASLDPEGAVSLMLPVDAAPGERVTGEIGNLVAETRYWVAVRAADRLNRHGPISVAQIETPARTFATVTPCFIATAAYGSPLAGEIRALRRLRDRYLMTNTPGRALVALYYAHGPQLAAPLRESEALRALSRSVLSPIVFAARLLAGTD